MSDWKKAEKHGAKDYRRGKKWSDCPYRPNTKRRQAWFNGFGDEGDKDFLKLIKVHPEILIDR